MAAGDTQLSGQQEKKVPACHLATNNQLQGKNRQPSQLNVSSKRLSALAQRRVPNVDTPGISMLQFHGRFGIFGTRRCALLQIEATNWVFGCKTSFGEQTPHERC